MPTLTADQLRHLLHQHAEQMLALTIAAADINSGSRNHAGIQAVDALFRAEFSRLPCQFQHIPLGDSKAQTASVFRYNAEAETRVLLLGHLDTVFPAESSFQHCWREQDRLRGPGVADMKGGVVIMLYALRALLELSRPESLGFTVVLTPDEEIGSPVSRPLLAQLAAQHDWGLVFEPSLENGSFAGDRKGSGNFSIQVGGRSVHAGRNFFNGHNAVVAAAELATEIAQLSDQSLGISVNVARIDGGSATNVVPDSATLELNIRVPSADLANSVHNQLQNLVTEYNRHSPCSFILSGEFHRPPKILDSQHLQLYELLRYCGAQFNQPVEITPTGGCCDGNNLSAAGLANIDTLGPRGGGIHSDREFLIIDSFVERAALTALLISELPSIGDLR